MTDQDETEQTEQNEESKSLKAGEVVTYTTTWDEERATVISIDGETAEVVPMSGPEKGEVLEKDIENLYDYEPMVWIAMLPHAWGKGSSQYQAIINATAHFREDKFDEEVTLWTGKVHRDNWEIEPYGGIRSKKIERDSEVEVDPELLGKISDVRSDNELLAEAASNGEEPAESYLKRVRKR